MKTLYLISTPISSDISCIPPVTKVVLSNTQIFICERIRTTRRFIKQLIPDFDIDSCTFLELDKHNKTQKDIELINSFKSGQDIAFLSEAGSPCIADPGSSIVNFARSYEYRIEPISGPSSIILALMSSGMNGQKFTFNGYLSPKKDELKRDLIRLEKNVLNFGYSQIFIETPYRNLQILETALTSLSHKIRLGVFSGIYTKDQLLLTKTIEGWKKDENIAERMKNKLPTIFIIGI